MLTTPVLFLIFNRPDLTERSFAIIKAAKPAKLFLAADGPRPDKEGEAELCRQTRQIVLDHIDWDCELHTMLRENNLGCKQAVSSAISWLFENVEEGIILEDDICPDDTFFPFCEEMLIKYKGDERITQISGVNLKPQEINNESYFFSKVGGIWGWATWRRVWQHYDVNINNWADKRVRDSIKQFLGKKDWFNRIKGSFEMVYKKELDTWDYQWVYTQMELNGLAIIPKKNLIENVGFRADATHTHSSNEVLESKMKINSIDFPLIHPKEVISNDVYTDYYFSLFDRPQPYYKRILKRIKAKIKDGRRKAN
jgi:hypothetical protein